MKGNAVDIIKSHRSQGGFIKTSDSPLQALSSEQKVLLNRKGNMLFNEGDYAGAQRLFITTGYSDGLSRIGDRYKKDGDDLTALRFYFLSHSTSKSEPIIENIAKVISKILNDNEGNNE